MHMDNVSVLLHCTIKIKVNKNNKIVFTTVQRYYIIIIEIIKASRKNRQSYLKIEYGYYQPLDGFYA